MGETQRGARTRYRRSRPIAGSAPKRCLPPRMAPPTPCRQRKGTQRKTGREIVVATHKVRCNVDFARYSRQSRPLLFPFTLHAFTLHGPFRTLIGLPSRKASTFSTESP